MNCLFCPDHIIEYTHDVTIHLCQNCKTRYYFSSLDVLHSYHFDISYKTCSYTFHFYLAGHANYGRFLLSSTIENITQFNYIPNFTPYNAVQKLQTLLIFS